MEKLKTTGWAIKHKKNNKLITKICLKKIDLPSLQFVEIFTEQDEKDCKIIKVEIKEI